MTVDVNKLREAIEEVAEIIREGREADAQLFIEIAAAYGLRPELLTRKFHKQFHTVLASACRPDGTISAASWSDR